LLLLPPLLISVSSRLVIFFVEGVLLWVELFL
jgi:hypothetical protein